MLFVVCLQLSFVICSCTSARSFFGYFTDDSISYSSITIPAASLSVDISIWTSSTKRSPSYVILGINRVPTISDFDAIFKLPPNGEVFQLSDHSPSKSVLYIGVWGGEMLHSYRYFGGSPTYYSTLVYSEIEMCNTDSQRGPFCNYIPEVALSPQGSKSSMLLKLGSMKDSQVRIPPGAESIELQLSPILSGDSVRAICGHYSSGATDSDSLILAASLFLQADGGYTDTCMDRASLNFAQLCQSADSSSTAASGEGVGAGENVSLVAERPAPGVWTLRTSVYLFLRVTGQAATEAIATETETRVDPEGIYQGVDDVLGGHTHRSPYVGRATGCVLTSSEVEDVLLQQSGRHDEVHIETLNKHKIDGFIVERKLLSRCQATSGDRRLVGSAVAVGEAGQTVGSSSDVVQVEVQVKATVNYCPAGFTGWLEYDQDSFVNSSMVQSYKHMYCRSAFVDMRIYGDQDNARSAFILSSAARMYTARADETNPSQIKEESPEAGMGGSMSVGSVVMRGRLDSLKFSPVGGVMFVQLVLMPSTAVQASPADRSVVVNRAFEVALRYGAIAGGEVSSILERNYEETAGTGGWSALQLNNTSARRMFMASPNHYIMSTLNSDSVTHIYGESGAADIVGVKYTWTVLKPRLGFLAGGDETFYVRVAPTASGTNTSTEEASVASYYDVKVTVKFGMCSQKAHCVHGECTVQEGDVTVSFCSCRLAIQNMHAKISH
jgi:hypothetical protein